MILFIINILLIVTSSFIAGYCICTLKWLKKIKKSINITGEYILPEDFSHARGRMEVVDELLNIE